MGNQLLKGYEVDQSQQILGGPYLKWNCIPARHRERQREAATFFVFEKSSLDILSDKYEKQNIMEILRKDCLNLQKLRHPYILPLIEPLVEDKTSLVFATRPISQTLANFIAENSNKKEFLLGGRVPLQIKAGLADICEALLFLHHDAKLAHLNISPSSIFISPSGRWYLGALAIDCTTYDLQGYAQPIQQQQSSPMVTYKAGMVSCTFRFERPSSLSTTQPYSVDPCLSYCSPEMTGNPSLMGQPSDLYSLGLVILQLASIGCRQLISLMGNFDRVAHHRQANAACSSIRSLRLSSDLIALLSKLLSSDPLSRGDIHDVLQSPFLNDVKVRALRFIDSIHEKSEAQQIQFLTGFKQLLLNDEENEFSKDIELLRQRVLPSFTNLLGSCNLFPSLLPSYLILIRKVCNSVEFQNNVWPKFRLLLTAREIQIDSVVMIITDLDFLISLSTDEMIQSDFLPFVIKCLGIPEPSIQYKLLDSLGVTAKRFDYAVLRSSVLPRLLSVLLDSQSSSKVRVRALTVLGEVSSNFDRATITEQIIGTIQKIPNIDRNPTVVFACATTLYGLSELIGSNLTATHILPTMSPLLVEENLDASQFHEVLGVYRKLINKVEEGRERVYRSHAEASASVQSVLGISSTKVPNRAICYPLDDVFASSTPAPPTSEPLSSLITPTTAPTVSTTPHDLFGGILGSALSIGQSESQEHDCEAQKRQSFMTSRRRLSNQQPVFAETTGNMISASPVNNLLDLSSAFESFNSQLVPRNASAAPSQFVQNFLFNHQQPEPPSNEDPFASLLPTSDAPTFSQVFNNPLLKSSPHSCFPAPLPSDQFQQPLNQKKSPNIQNGVSTNPVNDPFRDLSALL